MIVDTLQSQKNNALLLLWSTLLASSFYSSAQIVTFASPAVNTWIRFLIAVCFLLPLVAKQLRQYFHWAYIGPILSATVCLVLFFLLFFESLEHTSAFNTSVIYTLLPIITLLFSALINKSQCLWRQLPVFLLGSAGAVLLLLVVRPDDLSGFHWNWGDALFVAATALLALHVVLMQRQGMQKQGMQKQGMQRRRKPLPTLVGTFFVLAFGSILLTPFALLSIDSMVDLRDGRYWLIISWLAIFTTLGTVLLQQYLVKRVGSSHFIAYSYLIPVLVAIMADTLNSSNFVQSLPGLIMIIAALLRISRFSGAEKTATEFDSQPGNCRCA